MKVEIVANVRKQSFGPRYASGLIGLALIISFAFRPLASTWAKSPPEGAFIEGVSGYAQTYTLSCESRSAVDLAAFWGLEIGESDFLAKLPRSDNPDEGFVGSANDPWGYTPPYSYGVHADPIAKLLRKYGLRAEAHHGLKWKDLQAEIAAGRPVIVWVIGQMWGGSARTYHTESGGTTTVAPFEHSMILSGYDASRVQVVDPSSGQTRIYPLDAFLNSWSVLGNMAVLSRGLKETSPPATQEQQKTEQPKGRQESEDKEASQEAYTVQPGDYLVALAERFNTTWQELAGINQLAYPYSLRAGQVLQLPGRSQSSKAEPESTESGQFIPEAEPVVPDTTYVVKAGDYLTQISRDLGIDWRTLAELNGVGYPYVIYAGQILRLK